MALGTSWVLVEKKAQLALLKYITQQGGIPTYTYKVTGDTTPSQPIIFSISVENSNTKLNATDTADDILNNYDRVTIVAGAGNDSVRSTGDYVSIDGGAGNDSIYSYSKYSTIRGGSGNDTINMNSDGHNVIQYAAGDGDDQIWRLGETDTISITGGSYTASTVAGSVVLKIGNGSISIIGGASRTINIIGTQTPTSPTTPKPAPTPTISGGKYISNRNSNKTISGTGYADTVYNLGDTVKIDTGAGNDSIYSYSYYSTIKPATGNDTVSLNSNGHHNVIQYASGDGNDKIYNLTATDTLTITSGTYSSQTSGSDVIVTVGDGKITLVGGNGKTLNIKGTKTYTPTPTPTISGGKYISNLTSNKTINGTGYADTVYNLGDTVKIDTGAGNDSIYSYSYYSTIKPATGNDTVSLNSNGHHNVIQYASGDGNDKIYNLGSTDTLTITGGTYSSQTSGSDIVVTVGDGKITLVGGKGKTLNIKGTKTSAPTPTISGGKYLSNNNSNKKIAGTSKADTLYNYGSNVSINGGKGNDDITSFSGGSKVTLIGGKGKDTIYSWSAYSRIDGGDDADYLYAGAKYSTVLGGAGNDSIKNYGSYNSILGGKGNDRIENTNLGNYSTLSGGKGNDSLWGGSGKDTFIYANGDGKDVIFGFGNNDLLQITGTFSGTYNSSKHEAYFKVGSTANAITLKDFSATSFNINGDTYKISGSKISLNSNPKFRGIF